MNATPLPTRVPIPNHLAKYDWYAPHVAWLISLGYACRHDPGNATPNRANLRGADLSYANLRGADLSGADLRYANLRGADLSGADLRYADLSGANLSGANLSYANPSDANLSYANLSGANLSYANLSYADVPVVADLDAKILAAIEAGGSLNMSDWHTCETTHCRAGWAITLAGKEGRALEDRVGSSCAGALIYHASTGRVPDFFADDETAMADIRACASGKDTAHA